MKYERIAENIVASAVKQHLKSQIRDHCQKAAKRQAEIWLRKNRGTLNKAIGAAVDRRLNAEKDAVVRLAARNITIKAPVKRRSYY